MLYWLEPVQFVYICNKKKNWREDLSCVFVKTKISLSDKTHACLVDMRLVPIIEYCTSGVGEMKVNPELIIPKLYLVLLEAESHTHTHTHTHTHASNKPSIIEASQKIYQIDFTENYIYFDSFNKWTVNFLLSKGSLLWGWSAREDTLPLSLLSGTCKQKKHVHFVR